MKPSAPDLSGFGDYRVLRPLPGGHRNAVWLVEQAGCLFVAKSTRRSQVALDWLVPVQHIARAAGFTVPHLIRTATGDFISQGWVLEPFVNGRPALAHDMAGLYSQIAAVHCKGLSVPQRPGFQSVRALLAGALSCDVDLTALPPIVLAKCQDAWTNLSGDETIIHADINPNNIIMTQGAPALIDWDEARVDLPLFDLPPVNDVSRNARMAWEIACSWIIEPDHAKGLAAQAWGL